MKRRTFLQSTAAVSLAGTIHAGQSADVAVPRVAPFQRGSVAVDENRVRFFSDGLSSSLKVMMVADTHLFMDDERGTPFRQFSDRMAKAYNQTRHFQTGAATDPEECFVKVLQLAQESQVDLLALVGDLFSFPAERAVEWVQEKLQQFQVPYLYVAGNHDWHYEGMEGSLNTLRSTWINKRLLPLYQGQQPLMGAYDVQGVRFLAIDNSHYQILPEQLEFFRQQVQGGAPCVLLTHIPLYAPGRPLGFGCGHPEWGAKTDRNYQLERRPQWPTTGHTQATMDFHREVFSTPNLLGVFSGHIHRQSMDVIQGIPQFVTDANAKGAYLMAEFLPS